MTIYSALPRVDLGFFPTPLVFLKNLTAHLKGPAIYMKRDDCSGLVAGGNKVRKLEFLLGDALQQGCDTIITGGGMQSNHVRQTAAAAAKLGLQCYAVLSESAHRKDELYKTNGNVLLNDLLGVKLHIISAEADMLKEMNVLAERLIRKGAKPYLIPMGGSNEIGTIGYIAAAEEIYSECKTKNIKSTHLICATGSGGTQSGLVIGKHINNWDIKVIGFCVGVKNPSVTERIQNVMRSTCQLLKIETPATELLNVEDKYSGVGYGQPTLEAIQAIRLVAQTEGVLLDPVYTGKAMAGLIDYIKKGKLTVNDTIIFLHTGGGVALHAYAKIF